MDLINALTVKAKARPRTSRAAEGTNKGVEVESLRDINPSEWESPPNPRILREAALLPFCNAAINLRRAQAISADWEILPIDLDLSSGAKSITKEHVSEWRQKARSKEYIKKVQKIKQVLTRPNINGKNTSFAGLLGPVVGDILTLGVGCIIPTYNIDGNVISLTYVDAARLSFKKGWNTPEDGFRYKLSNAGERGGILLHNNELITPVLNENTYNNIPASPVLLVYEDLIALRDTIQSVHVLQKNRTPASIVNFDGMSENDIKRVRRLFDTTIASNHTVGFTNHPLDDVKVLTLGNVNIQEQGAPWFVEYLIHSIAAAFQVSTSNLQWIQDANRSIVRESIRITEDQGIEPLMRMIADYINSEVVSTYGDENLQFVWTELLVKDEAQSADTIRKRFGIPGGSWVTLNEARRADGLTPIHTDPHDPLYSYYNEALLPAGTGIALPVSVVAQSKAAQPADIAHQHKLEELQANKAGNDPSPSSTEDTQAAQEDTANADDSPSQNEEDTSGSSNNDKNKK